MSIYLSALIAKTKYKASALAFTPTYLYIKQHKITKKLYFGKTCSNPILYKGSGKRWLSHIKYHGINETETLWFCEFQDSDSIIEFALTFSFMHNIGLKPHNENWLNLIPEDGLCGIPVGMVVAKDANLNVIRTILCDEYFSDPVRYSHSRTGKVNVKCKETNKSVSITTDEYEKHKEKYIHSNTLKTVIIDTDGISRSIDSVNYNPSIHKTHSSGMITAKNKITQEFKSVSVAEYTVDSNLTGVNHNKVIAKNLVTNKIEMVDSVIFDANKDLYSGVTAGLLTIRVKSTGKNKQITKSEFQLNKHLYEFTLGKLVAVIDYENNRVKSVSYDEYCKNKSSYTHVNSLRGKEFIKNLNKTKCS